MNTLVQLIRRLMRAVARFLNSISRGKITPDSITTIGLLAHLPIAYLIATGHFGWAAGLLLVFGLFDTLDGELARLQKRASSAGMLYDASTDRFKEVLLYSGIAYWLSTTTHPHNASWAVLALGASLSVSYVKAKGETAVKNSRLTPNEINRLFQDGLLRFEFRIALLILGLASNRLLWATIIIAVLASYTALSRLVKIRQALHVQG